MNHVHEVRWRLLREQLETVYRQAQRQQESVTPLDGRLPPDVSVEILLRLAGATLTILEWHGIAGLGRCRMRACSRWRWIPWWSRRACQVFVTVQFWVEQPLWLVKKVGRTLSDTTG
ncbi:MAG: hypothetical protein ACRDRI_04130 [Pseudonocardiaceae bacterium]